MSVGDIRTLNIRTARSSFQNIDNGAGTTVDEVLVRPAHSYYPVAARIVYEDATSGAATSATYGLGITVAGVEVLAATALEASKAVGATTACTLTATYTQSNPIPANTPLISRYTGVATTVLGAAHIEVDYIIVGW